MRDLLQAQRQRVEPPARPSSRRKPILRLWRCWRPRSCKQGRDIQHGKAVGIQLTTFDAESELDKIAEHHPEVGLVLRIRADDKAARCNLGDKVRSRSRPPHPCAALSCPCSCVASASAAPAGSQTQPLRWRLPPRSACAQYGAEEQEWEPLLRGAKARGLEVVGISFHVGSGATNPAAFPVAVAKARQAFDAALALGFDMRVLDLGGGFSGNLSGGVTMAAVAASLNAALEEHFPAAGGVKVIAEPGRYFAEPGMTLFTRVFGKRCRERANADSRYYWIADGVYGSMNCLIYDHAVLKAAPFPAVAGEAQPAGPLMASTVYGPTCDGMDTLLRGCMLPDLEVGAWLQWPSMGAYTLAAGSAFNGFDSQAVDVHYVFTAAQ